MPKSADLRMDDAFWEKMGKTVRDQVKSEMKSSFTNFKSEMKKLVHEEVTSAVDTRFKTFETEMNRKIDAVKDDIKTCVDLDVEPLKTSLQFQTDRLDDLSKVGIPALAAHVEKVTSALALQTLNLDVHRRKWSLTVHGLPGAAHEDEADTRRAVIQMAQQKLKIQDASPNDLAACHRLKPDAGAGIILRFNDLSKRNKWMTNARNLRGMQISLSADSPPCLRPCVKELADIKRTLPDDTKKRSHIRYLPQWPYAFLHMPNGQRRNHTYSKANILKNALALDTSISFAIPQQ